jgi:hypothetical protein
VAPIRRRQYANARTTARIFSASPPPARHFFATRSPQARVRAGRSTEHRRSRRFLVRSRGPCAVPQRKGGMYVPHSDRTFGRAPLSLKLFSFRIKTSHWRPWAPNTKEFYRLPADRKCSVVGNCVAMIGPGKAASALCMSIFSRCRKNTRPAIANAIASANNMMLVTPARPTICWPNTYALTPNVKAQQIMHS